MSAGRPSPLLWLQRRVAWIPAPLRRLARALLGARLEGAGAGADGVLPAGTPGIDDWATPLVGVAAASGIDWPASSGNHRLSTDPTAPGGTGSTLRCLLVTDSIDASGMDEFVGFLARRLRRYGIVTAVMIGSDDTARGIGRLGRALAAEGVEVADPGRDAGAAWMREWRPDVVSVHGSADWPLEAAADLAVPVVETLHGMHNLFGADPADVVRRRDRLAGLVSVSEMVRLQYLALDHDLDPNRIVTIPNGVDSHRVRPVARDLAREALGLTDEFLFVSLARHSLQKNGFALASAFGEVAAAVPGAHLLICGRSDDRSYTGQVVDLKRRMPHGDRLHLRDNTSHVAALLAAADAFALDSFFEGWSLSSMEALASGLPVVISDVGGAREQLGGRVAKGALVANPLGDPLAVDWPSISAARFRPQANRQQLVDAMTGLARGTVPVATRAEIADESLARFDDELCVRRHAHAVTAAANARPIHLTGDLAVAPGATEGTTHAG